MCNACGFYCCASDQFEGCGCDHCEESACWPRCEGCGEVGCDGECRDDEDDYRGPASQFVPCPAPGCDEGRRLGTVPKWSLDGQPADLGECTTCGGVGEVEAEREPRTEEDLDEQRELECAGRLAA